MKRSSAIILSTLTVSACSDQPPVNCDIFKDDVRCKTKTTQSTVATSPITYMPYRTTQHGYVPLTSKPKSIMYMPHSVSRPLSLPPQVSRGGFGKTSVMSIGS